MLQHAEGKEQ